MMILPCPYCGPCDETEFVCGGESHIQRPGPPAEVSDEAWADYLFYRNNIRGVTFERWYHRYGCMQWINVARHTVSHEILAGYTMADKKPTLS